MVGVLALLQAHLRDQITDWTKYFSRIKPLRSRQVYAIYDFAPLPTFCRAFIYAHSVGGVSEGTKLRSNQKKQENRFPNEQRIVYLVVLIVLPLPAHC